MNEILRFSARLSNWFQKIISLVLYTRRYIWKKRTHILGSFLLISQFLSPLTVIIAYAAPVSSNQVGSSAALDPVGNKATRLQTQGSSGVDQSSGALTYSYPLTIPDGRNGMSPKLALSYNSQNNDTGWFGHGWTMSIPYIERTAKTGTDKMYSNPAFVSSLHGELVSSDGYSFEQKIDDGSYSKYTFTGNTWKMTDRDGTTYYFGDTYSSRIQDETGAKIGRWYITEVRDKFGNGIIYNYTKDSGTIYPSTISYTEHALAHPLNLVTFNLENKNDKTISYKYGFKTVDTKRVSYIKTSTNGKDNSYFTFNYTTGSNGVRSLLQFTEERHLGTNDDWTTLPKTVFEYENSPVTFNGTISNSINSYGSNVVIDTNNDGIQDLYSPGDGYYPIDINGDYKKDLMQSDVTYGAYTNGRYVNFKYNQAGGFYTRNFINPYSPVYLRSFPSGDIVPPIRYMPEGGWSYVQDSVITDVNGDGFDDIVYNDPYGGNNVAINTTNNSFTYPSTSGLSYNFTNDQLVDVNADGLQDKISKSYTATSTLFSIYLNTGTGYLSTPDFIYDAKVPQSGYDIGVRFVDINNDGLIDIIRSYNSIYSNVPPCGGGYLPPAQNLRPYNQTVNELNLNTGNSFVLASSTLQGYVVLYTGCPDIFSNGIQSSFTKEYDTNGDLTTDYDGATNNTAKQDVLKKVTSSLGATTDVSYTWTTKTGLNPTLPVPMYIVATTTDKLSVSDQSPHTVGYSFSNGQMYFDANAPRDHKFAGFGKVDVVDGKNKTTTYYHQGNGDDYTTGEKGDSYYNIGRPYRTDTFDLSSGILTLVNKNVSLYATYSNASSSFTYLDSQVSSTYNSDGNFLSSGSKNVYDETKRLIKTSYNYGDIEPFISFASSTITDKGTDILTTQYQYSNTRPQRLVKQVTIDYAGNNVSNASYYYDNLPLGLVDKGAVTSVFNNVYNSDGTLNSTSTTQTVYDATGNIIQTIDNLNHKTTINYDSSYFFPVTKVDALNGTTTITYDPYTLNVLSTKGPDGITYVKETDGLSKVTRSYKINNGGGMSDETKTSYVYAGGISVYSKNLGDSGASARSLQIYDSFGRLIQSKTETSPDVFSTQDTKYDSSSNVISTSLPYTTTGYGLTTDTPSNGSIIYSYDGLGRVISKSSFGTTLSYQYGARSLTVFDNASTQHKKFYTYDANGNISQVKEYNGGDTYTTNYNYTPTNKLSRITDASGNIRNFLYLSNGSLVYQEDPHPSTDTTFTTYLYTYDSLGNLITKSGPLGSTSYIYDALNRPTSRILGDNTYGTSTVNIGYTGCSNNYTSPCIINRQTSSTTLAYNPSGRLSSETLSIDGNSFARSYAYDTFGNPTTITYPDNGKTVYTYTLDGKQSTLSYITPSGATKNIVTNSTYNSLGALSSLSFGNGVQMCNTYTNTSADGTISPKLAKSTYLFNSTGCSQTGGTQIELYKDEFTYKDNLTPSVVLSTYKDIAGTSHTKSDSFVYDNLARLTQVSTSYDGGTATADSLVYDPIGNILKENDVLYRYSQDGNQNAHAATSIGGTHITYDAQGNRTQVGDSSYTWNALNQMVSASSTNGTEMYTYDENGERIKKVVKANTIINQKVTPATASSTVNSFKQGDLLAVVATSSAYIASSTYNTLNTLSLLSTTTLSTLVSGYYSSPFTSKFCATATSTSNRQSCIVATTKQLIANNINSRSTTTAAITGLVDDMIKITTGEYIIPSSYTGIATSSIATSDTTTFVIDNETISSYNTFVSTGVVVPMAQYANLPYVSSSTYITLLSVGLNDTSKVKALLTLTGCNSVSSACTTAEKVVFEKFYKNNGYLLSDKVLQEMWYVYAAKARLPANVSEFTATSTTLGSINIPTVSGISTSSATSTYYSGLYFTNEYNTQSANEPRLQFFNTIPYYVTQSAFTELQQAGITQTTIENYQALIGDLFNIKTASTTEYITALNSFVQYDKKSTLSYNALKELYLVVLGAAIIPNNVSDYIASSMFDLAPYLSVQTVYGSYASQLSNTTTGCNGGSYNGYGRCMIRVSPFTLPVATSSTVSYLLSVTAPNPTEFILNAGESVHPRDVVDNYNYGTQVPYIYSYRYAPAIPASGALDYISGTISSDGFTQTIDVSSTVVKEMASSTEPSVILLMNRSGWTNGQQFAYQSQNTSLKAYVNTPRLTLASTTLVSTVTSATSSSYTSGIQSTTSAYFGKNYDSSSSINIGTTSPLVFISPESYAEFTSTTLRDAYDISKVFLATSTSQCALDASTTECDKQIRKTSFREIITNLSGFTPSQAATEEFWMVHKGILTLPNINYASSTATTTVAGYYTSTSTPGAWLITLSNGYYTNDYTATTTASTSITILNTQAGGTTFTPGSGSQYILAFCGKYCDTPTFNGVSMTFIKQQASPNTNSDVRIYGLATTTASSVSITSSCGTYCGNATDHYRWVSLKGLNTSSYYYDTQGSGSNSASTLSVTENIQDKNNLTFVTSNISSTGTSGGIGSSPLNATTTSRVWYHYATTTGNFTYSVTGLSTDAEIASIQMKHDLNDTVTPGFWTNNYHATTTTYYIATSSAMLPAIVSSTSTSYPVFSRNNLPPTLSTSTVSYTSTTTVPGYWATVVTTQTPPSGGATTTSGLYTIHKFTSSGTFVSLLNFNAEVLVIGGGGSGSAGNGSRSGAGGGAGGYIYSTSTALTAQSYTVTVGSGGQNSVFANMTALAGGNGGGVTQNGSSGASGGGGGDLANGGTASSTQGHIGGNGASYSSGGGGGADTAGSNSTNNNGGNGGNGISNNITGTSIYYAGGGGGGGSSVGGSGGLGGGGNGHFGSSCTNGVPNTGGGGGGAVSTGCSGGSGVVIIKYLTSLFQGTSTTQVYIATSTIVIPVTHLDLVPPGLLSGSQFNTLYSTSTFAIATTTRTISQDTYNELLHTPIRLNSDVDTIFNYAIPFATSTCSGQSATSSCVISAQKQKVKDTVGELSGFLFSDSALEELYRVNNNSLSIIPINTDGSILSTDVQTITLPMQASSSFMTFATSSSNFTQTPGVCSFGTTSGTSSRCYVIAPDINSPVTQVKFSYDFATSSVATSTITTSLIIGTSTATTTIVTGQKATSTFAFDLTSAYQSYLSAFATSSASLTLSPNDIASSTIYTVTNPKLTLYRVVGVPVIAYDNNTRNIAFSRSDISSFSTSTATTTVNMSTNYGLTFSQGFISPFGPFATITQATTTTEIKVATTSLVGYWKLDESSGNASDASGNGKTLTASSVTFATGQINNGANIGSAGQYFGRNDSMGITNGNFTVSTWIKPSSLPTSDQSGYSNTKVFFAMGNTSTNVSFFMTLARMGGVQKITINRQRQLAENGEIDYTFTTPTTSFTHVAGTYNGSVLTLYVNGSAVANYTVTGLNGSGGPSSDETRIGSDAGAYGSNYTGLVDEVGVWSRALTSTEISNLYNSSTGLQYPFIVTSTSTAQVVYTANTAADTSIAVLYQTLPSVTPPALSAITYPNATSTATSSLYQLTSATTTTITTYTPFGSSYEDSRGVVTTYLTLNGTLVGAYSYQKGNEASTGKVTFVHTNYLGTPVLETDDKGDIVQMDITDVFGNYVQRDQRMDNAYHNKGYTGHEYDDTTNLIYARARYLDQTAHSFLSVDPVIYSLSDAYLKDPQQMNSYAYVRNNPIIYTDPTGKCLEDLCIGEVAVGTYLVEAFSPVVVRQLAVWATGGAASQYLSNTADDLNSGRGYKSFLPNSPTWQKTEQYTTSVTASFIAGPLFGQVKTAADVIKGSAAVVATTFAKNAADSKASQVIPGSTAVPYSNSATAKQASLNVGASLISAGLIKQTPQVRGVDVSTYSRNMVTGSHAVQTYLTETINQVNSFTASVLSSIFSIFSSNDKNKK